MAPTAGSKRSQPDSDQVGPLRALHALCLWLQLKSACTDSILEQAFCFRALPGFAVSGDMIDRRDAIYSFRVLATAES